MKKMFFSIIIVFISTCLFSQKAIIPVKVDERIELLSTVCRLADYLEYNEMSSRYRFGSIKYVEEVDEYFAKYKTNSLILYAKHIRKKQGIAYDAPMSFAISLEIKDSIRFLPNLAQGIEKIDKRWTEKSARYFLSLLNKFYKETNFHSFFEQHQKTFSTMENNFNSCVNEINLDWYNKFFGTESKDTFKIILSGINGGDNYGPKVTYSNGTQTNYSVMGPWVFDTTLSIQSKSASGIQKTIIHEFNHSFCNPLIDKYFNTISSNSNKMYKCVKSTMKSQAYSSSKTMMYELLVRSCVMKYLKDNTNKNESELKKSFVWENLNGFFWIDSVVYSLEKYDKLRDKYPTLDSYMPKLAELINSLETKNYIKRFNQKRTEYHVHTSIANGDENVSPDTKSIVISFDCEMDVPYGCSYGKKGKKALPNIKSVKWSSNQRDCIFYVELEANKQYSISFPYQWFYNKEGYPGKGIYYLDFKTGK